MKPELLTKDITQVGLSAMSHQLCSSNELQELSFPTLRMVPHVIGYFKNPKDFFTTLVLHFYERLILRLQFMLTMCLSLSLDSFI
jgi:hypothetical protein